MKKYIVVIVLAVLMLASAMIVEGKHQQSANVQSEIDGGHHNTIITNIGQVSQVINRGGNIPYGQLKKVAGVGKKDQIADGNINQSAIIGSQIIGGHHNTIITDSNQLASVSGAQTAVNNSTAFGNLDQILNVGNTIDGGHHNVILVGSVQSAYVNTSSSGNISQTANINNQIDGGHHNLIFVGSSQIAQVGSIAGLI